MTIYQLRYLYLCRPISTFFSTWSQPHHHARPRSRLWSYWRSTFYTFMSVDETIDVPFAIVHSSSHNSAVAKKILNNAVLKLQLYWLEDVLMSQFEHLLEISNHSVKVKCQNRVPLICKTFNGKQFPAFHIQFGVIEKKLPSSTAFFVLSRDKNNFMLPTRKSVYDQTWSSFSSSTFKTVITSGTFFCM